MKKFVLFTVVFLILCVGGTQAGLEYVGLTDVATTYTAQSQTFAMYEEGLVAIKEYDAGPQVPIYPASFDLSTQLISGMHFEGGTFVLSDNLNTLLSGDVISIDFTLTEFGSLEGNGTALVVETGIDDFPVGPASIISLTFEIEPAFAGFDQDYTGSSKVNLGVPEPGMMALLGLGCISLLRKRK